jgi:hypothetical protein
VIRFRNVYYLFTGGNSAPNGSDVFHLLPGGFEDEIGLQIDHATLDFSQYTPGITVNLPDATGQGNVPGALLDSFFSGNSALAGGGIYKIYRTLTRSGCTLTGNSATAIIGNGFGGGNGGSIYNREGLLTLNGLIDLPIAARGLQ